MSERFSGTVTFLFTDIEGSTNLLKALGRERYGQLLTDQQQLLRDAFAAHNGEEVDTQGDSFFVAFRGAGDALLAAVAIQRALAEHVWHEGSQVRVRIGIHSGEAAGAADRYVGISVHRAARVGAVAHGGQVLVSDSTRVLVEDDLPTGVNLRDLGFFRLKDIDRPERISQLEADGLRETFPTLRGAERVKVPLLGRRSLLAAVLVGVLAVVGAVALFALTRAGSGNSTALTSVGANAVGAVDMSTNHIVGSVPLGTSPGAVAFGEASVWVALPDQDAVSRIDPKTNTVQQTIPVGNNPAGIAVGGGFVWVVNSLDGTVWQIDPRANGGQAVSHFSIGNGPTGVAYGLGAVWVANSVDRTVVRIDPLTDKKAQPIPVEAGADAIAVGDGAVWVTSESAGVLSRVDPGIGGVTKTFIVGSGPVAVAAGPDGVWVANSREATVSHINPAGKQAPVTIPVGEGPSGVALTPGAKSVWVSNKLAGTLSRIDPAAGRVVKTVPVGALPQGVAASSKTVYVSVRGSGSAHRGGTLTLLVPNPPGVYNVGFPKSLDPAQGYTAWELLTLTNDGLMGYGRSGGADSYKVVPDLAVAPPTVTDGGRTYIFQPRSGIRYSTGAPVRLGDFRRGIERALLSSGADTPSSYLSGIIGAARCTTTLKHCDLSKGIVADPESNTVSFHLTGPDPDFLYKLALPVADAVPAGTPLKARLPLPATGPYKIAGFNARQGVIRLVRNPRFRLWSAAAQPDGFPDKIIEKFGYTGEDAVRAVERGKADITGDGLDLTWSPALTSLLRTRYSSRLYHPPPALATTVVWLNTRVPPFDDLRVRQALNYAVDRNHLVELAGGRDVAQVGCQLLPPNSAGYRRYCPYTRRPNGAGTYNGPDLTKARHLVAASGTKGQRVTVWFYKHVRIGLLNGNYFVSVLKNLGYKAQLRLVPHNQSTWRVDRQAGVGGWGEFFPSANDFFSPGFSCRSYDPAHPNMNQNTARLCDRHIDAEMTRARTLQTTDPLTAAKLWSTIDHEITDRAPGVVIRSSLAPDLVSRRIGNYTDCYLSNFTGSTGACLDQLWVH